MLEEKIGKGSHYKSSVPALSWLIKWLRGVGLAYRIEALKSPFFHADPWLPISPAVFSPLILKSPLFLEGWDLLRLCLACLLRGFQQLIVKISPSNCVGLVSFYNLVYMAKKKLTSFLTLQNNISSQRGSVARQSNLFSKFACLSDRSRCPPLPWLPHHSCLCVEVSLGRPISFALVKCHLMFLGLLLHNSIKLFFFFLNWKAPIWLRSESPLRMTG